MQKFILLTLLMILLFISFYFCNQSQIFNKTFHFENIIVNSFKDSRYPQIEVVPYTKNLTLRLKYDIARPLECEGADCRAFWVDHYEYDPNIQSFQLVNDKYKEYYRELYKGYEKMNKVGCTLGTSEGENLITLEDVYKFSNSAYCKGKADITISSSREELNKYFQFRELVKKSQ